MVFALSERGLSLFTSLVSHPLGLVSSLLSTQILSSKYVRMPLQGANVTLGMETSRCDMSVASYNKQMSLFDYVKLEIGSVEKLPYPVIRVFHPVAPHLLCSLNLFSSAVV